jgi:hypothetical protein
MRKSWAERLLMIDQGVGVETAGADVVKKFAQN